MILSSISDFRIFVPFFGKASFMNRIFPTDLGEYTNFSVKGNSLFSIRMVIIGIMAGIIIASAISVYNKRYIGNFIRKLISEDCLCPEKAKKLSEIGYLGKFGIISKIKTGGPLFTLVKCAEEDEFYAESKKNAENGRKEKLFVRDCKTMHFYIPEEKKYALEVKFEKKGSDMVTFFLVSILTVFFTVLIFAFLPDILTYVDNFISIVK